MFCSCSGRVVPRFVFLHCGHFDELLVQSVVATRGFKVTFQRNAPRQNVCADGVRTTPVGLCNTYRRGETLRGTLSKSMNDVF